MILYFISFLGYCNADWVGCPIDKRSTTNIIYSLEAILSPRKARKKMLLSDQV